MTKSDPFRALLDISEEIAQLNDAPELLNRILDRAIDVLGAERGFMLLKAEENDANFLAVAARNMSNESIADIRELSSSVVNNVLTNGEAVLTFDAQSDERFSEARSILIQKIRSIICTPLILSDTIHGAIYVDSQTQAERFNDESLRFLQAFARQAAIAIDNQRRFEKLETSNQRLKKQLSYSQVFPEIIGESKEVQEMLDLIDRVAEAKAAVLIEGESGTGKELVARALHSHSSRKEQLFVPVFCGGLAESLLESELFGHRKGAFTGAIENKAGLFEEADGGTVFLDEIGEINTNIQTKLLRVIQEGEIKRVGETVTRKVNVRVVSATNKDLWEEVQAKRFREDLYYRLNVISIKMPPLRDRGNDIQILANHFLTKFARENGKQLEGFNAAALKILDAYQWPGNIRELENTVERAVIMASDKTITADLLALNKVRVSDLVGRSLQEVERALIMQTLELTGGHRGRTAEILGVSRRWLQYRIKEWDLAGGEN
ncbi:MAG: sigma-54 interaction domain-containing protein [Calditrichia bacterium]